MLFIASANPKVRNFGATDAVGTINYHKTKTKLF
jgi:hypothetical protein